MEKLFSAFILGPLFFHLTAAQCTTATVNGCQNTFTGTLTGLTSGLSGEIPSIVKAQYDAVCTATDTFSKCLDDFRSECDFAEKIIYEKLEQMYQYLCDNENEYENYLTASETAFIGALSACFLNDGDAADLDDTSNSNQCNILDEILDCAVEVGRKIGTKKNVHLPRGFFAKRFTKAAFTAYDDEYDCNLGERWNAGEIIGLVAGCFFGLVLLIGLGILVYKCCSRQSFGHRFGYGPEAYQVPPHMKPYPDPYGPPPPPNPRYGPRY